MSDNTNPFASEDITPPFNDEWVAKRRVADTIRQLTEALTTSSPSVEEMHAIADALQTAAEGFRGSPRIFGRRAWAETKEHGSYGQISHELNPLTGWSNPIAPPLNCWIDGERAFGACECGWAYEGPPGSVHGGMVAAIFDQFLGMAQQLGGQPGMTGYLHLDYHRRTPLNTPLRLEGWLVEIERRKTLMRGEMRADGELTASCECLFVQPRGGLASLRSLKTAED